MSLKAQLQAVRKRAWDGRPAQDRRALAVAAAVLGPGLAYAVLWHPAHVAVANLKADLPTMRMQAALMKREAGEVEALQAQAKPAVLTSAAMKATVETSAAEFQLRSAIESMDGIEPNGVRVTFSSVPFAQWLSWTRHLQQEQHIRVNTLSVVALQTEGMVKISATLVNGGSP